MSCTRKSGSTNGTEKTVKIQRKRNRRPWRSGRQNGNKTEAKTEDPGKAEGNGIKTERKAEVETLRDYTFGSDVMHTKLQALSRPKP